VEALAFSASEDAPQFQEGDEFRFRVWDAETDREHSARAVFIEGPEVWADGGQSRMNLSVTSLANQTLALRQGWNMISLNLDPVEFYPNDQAPGPDHQAMFAQLVDEEGNLILDLLKDGLGRFWSPEWDFNSIPYWNPLEGYQIKVSRSCEAVFEGIHQIPPGADIPVHPRWNLIPYFPDYELGRFICRARLLCAITIIESVLIAKDGDGLFLWPEWGFPT
jgi:hypothetical protein